MFKIQPSEPTDFFGIVRLLKLADYQTLDIGGSKVVNNFISAMAENGDLAGVVGIELADTNMLLRSLAVDKRYLEQGVEELLVKTIEDTAYLKGMRKLYTLMHKHMQPFFENLGYEVVEKDRIPLNMKATDEYAFLKTRDYVCLLKKTSHFIQEEDDEHEVYDVTK